MTKKVTPADVAAAIRSEFYFTAADGVLGESEMGTRPAGRAESLSQLTFCVLVLDNGAKVVGINYGAIDPAGHSAEMGRAEARKEAENKVWELLGFRLRDRLAGPTDAMVQRFLQWPVPAHIYPDGTPGQPGRIGTNLLDAVTARDMLAHVLAA